MALDSIQISAVEHIGSPLLVTAGPGSGKTFVIIERIKFLLKTGLKPSEILCLTFSEKAANEIKEEQVKNWFVHFGVIKRNHDWHQIHVSGHGDGEQIKYVVENTNAKSLIPIHTVKDEYHKKWHKNVKSVKQHDLVSM